MRGLKLGAVCGLVTSAGSSSRLGTHKALLSLPNGTTLLSDQVERLSRSGISDILVVIGCDAKKIKGGHDHLCVQWMENTGWRRGNFSSIICGLKEICGIRPRGVILIPVDVAGVDPQIISTIIQEGIRSKKNIIPTYNGRGGHPVYIRAETVMYILTQPPKTGRLDCILTTDPATKRLPVDSKAILNNINTRKDWQEYTKCLKILQAIQRRDVADTAR